MNRRARQTFLRDVRLAARFGDPEALDAALEGLRAEPAIAANHEVPPDVISRLLIPAGQALAAATVPVAYLNSLAASPYAAYRALAAIAWGERFARGQSPSPTLNALARDPRPEVRQALRLALQRAARPRLAAWIRAWLTPRTPPRSPRAVALAWDLAPQALPPAELWDRAAVWAARDEAADLHPALVRALQQAAAQDPDLALERLRAAWEHEHWPAPVIAQVLAGPWVATRPDAALALLRALHARHGRRRWLTQALKALERHHVIADAEAVLRGWTQERP